VERLTELAGKRWDEWGSDSQSWLEKDGLKREEKTDKDSEFGRGRIGRLRKRSRR